MEADELPGLMPLGFFGFSMLRLEVSAQQPLVESRMETATGSDVVAVVAAVAAVDFEYAQLPGKFLRRRRPLEQCHAPLNRLHFVSC